MKKELEDKLVRDFPLLYKEYGGSQYETCMAWGFECSDGWFALLYEASVKLEPLIEEYRKENPQEEYLPCASQVKEKFGTLRFYLSTGTREMYAIVDEAEELSGKTCEVCGKEGKTGGTGWYRTLCDNCNTQKK